MLRNFSRLGIFAVWVACVGTAFAQGAPLYGTVLAPAGTSNANTDADFYVDLGGKHGVGEGAILELEHLIVATDPTTGSVLRDHFALGTLTVTQSGDGISIARAAPDLARRIAPGDRVRLTTEKKTYVDAWRAQIDSAGAAGARSTPDQGVRRWIDLHKPASATASDHPMDHLAAARDAWQATLGQPLEQRIERWQQLLVDDPQTPYRRPIETELANLKRQLRARDVALAQARSTSADRAARIAQLAAELTGDREQLLGISNIGHTEPGRPTPIAVTIANPRKVGRVYLYARSQNEVGYHRSELIHDGDAYMRGQIPANASQWYAEVVPPDGGPATPAIGSPNKPRELEVARDVTEPPPATGRSHVDIHFDYVDFDGKFSKGYDHYYQVEGDFMYRFLQPIYAVRLGFGSLTGIGGPKDVIDHDPLGSCRTAGGDYACKRVTFSYVYSEYEFKLSRIFALLLRPQIGVLSRDAMPGADAGRCQTRDAVGCQFLTGVGGRIRLRIGDEQSTNLVLGASFSRGIGTLLEANYHWLPARVVPVQVSVQVTDQPVVDNFGVRLIGDIGYRRLGWFYPSLRLSYQARSLEHTGVSGGMALNFDW